MSLASKSLIYLIFLTFLSDSTVDINLSEYQYIADHLTEEECHQLVAALHFRSFEMPKEINSAERRLPDDVPCIDLLLHWNSTPREGKGETHVEVCFRLNQIGREDLAKWLSKTVFHQISKDLRDLNTSEITETTASSLNVTEVFEDEKIIDEAAWWKLDSILSILIVIGVILIVFGSFYLCFLCCTKNALKESPRGYKKLPTSDD